MARLADLRREWRWRRKRAQMYARSDVLILSRTKSGRTWLRVMLSHLFHQQYGIPERELVQFDNFHRLECRIPRVHFTHDTIFMHHRPWGRVLRARPRQALLFLVSSREEWNGGSNLHSLAEGQRSPGGRGRNLLNWAAERERR